MTVMDDAERRRLIETLRSDEQFRADVRREILTDELLQMPQTVASLTTAVAEQGRALADLRQTLSTVVEVVAEQRRDVADLTRLVTDSMERTTVALERTVALVEEGFAQLRREMADLRSDMDGKFAGVGTRLDRVDAELRELHGRPPG